MAAAPPATERRRARPGSLERPVNGRLYRGTWLLVGLPLLVLAFSVARPAALEPPSLPSAFDQNAAKAIAVDLARTWPDRLPGTPGAAGAASWYEQQLTPYGFTVDVSAIVRRWEAYEKRLLRAYFRKKGIRTRK